MYVCMCVCVCVCVYAVTIDEQEAMHLKQRRKRYMGGFGGIKRKEKMLNGKLREQKISPNKNFSHAVLRDI